MSDENLPYTTPQPQPQQPFQQQPQPPQKTRSGVPKVMGILHIVFAAFGMLGSFSAFFTSSIIKGMQLSGIKEIDTMTDAMNRFLTYTYIDAGVKIILGILLLVSGIKLLSYQSSGLKLSNLWSFTRIIWAIVYTVISYSSMIQYQQAMLAGSPGAGALVKSIGTASMVIGILTLCIYPIVSLILLNRPKVKEDLT